MSIDIRQAASNASAGRDQSDPTLCLLMRHTCRKTNPAASLRRHIALLFAALVSLGLAMTASATPASVTVCTQVIDNADLNTTEGGSWQYSVANQSITLATPSNQRNESQQAAAPACQPAVPLPGGSSALSVTQSSTPPANWLRNAQGYPQWSITDGSKTITGSGLQAVADATSSTTFSQLGSAVTVTFANASGRLVTKICKILQDNGDSKHGQGGNFTLTAAGGSTTFNGIAEGDGPACNSTIATNIPLGATSISVIETAVMLPAGSGSYTSAPGYPQVQGIDSANVSNSLSLFFNNVTYSGVLPLAGTKGDITVNFTNRIDPSRTVTICKLLDDMGIYVGEGVGTHLVDFGVGTTLSLTVDGGTTPACTLPLSASSGDTTTAVREVQYPGTLTGFAQGYPQWDIYEVNADNSLTALLHGTGAVADIPWSNAALSGVQNVRVQFTDRAGQFGNGSQANTGMIVRLCKYVEDNGNGIVEGGSFNILGFNSDSAVAAHASGLTPTINEGTLSCPVTMARWTGDNTAFFSEQYAAAGWAGNIPGYPQIRIFNVAAPNAGSTPLSQTVLSFSETPGLQSSFGGSAALPTTGDVSAVIYNKTGATARTITFCVRVDDNGLAPTTDGGVWTFQLPAGGSVTATEGSGEKCTTPVPMPDPNGSWSQPYYLQTVSAPAGWPGYDSYGSSGPTADDGTKITTAPYVAYTTGTTTGILPASATTGQMSWAGSQTFFQGISGNLKATFVVRPSARYRICSQVLQNGDSTNDSNTFVLSSIEGSATAASSPLTDTEGTLVTPATAPTSSQCVSVVSLPALGALSASEALSTSWDTSRTTPGFPQWSLTSSGGTAPPLNQTGSGLNTTTIPQLPASQQGDTTVIFSNRLGASRFLTLCKKLLDNGDGANDSNTFTLNGTSNDPATPTFGPYALSVTEGAAEVCSAPVQVPTFATMLSSSETLPVGFISASGFPTWTVRHSDGSTVATGSATSTGAIDLNGIDTPDLSVLFQNKVGNSAELTITKTANQTSVIAGGTVSYTINVTNNGPLVATSVVVKDVVPAGLTLPGALIAGCPTCTTTTAPDKSYITASVPTLAVGQTQKITVTFTVPAGYLTSGGISPFFNTATVTEATRENNTGDDSATDAGTKVTASADLSITKSGPSIVSAGAPISYTLTISNAAGSSAVGGATYQDSVPAGITSVTAVCGSPTPGAVCGTAAATGNNVTGAVTTLPPGGSVLVTVSGTAPNNPTSLSNTATVAVPAGVTETNPGNNTSAAVVTTVNAVANLTLTNSDGVGVTTYKPGGSTTYTIVAGNPGPSTSTNASFASTLSGATPASWTCIGSGGAVCPTTAGTGNISALITLPAAGSLTYSLTANVALTATGNVVNVATLTNPAGTSPATMITVSDTDSLCNGCAINLKATIDDFVSYVQGGITLVNYTIVVSNIGSSVATGALVLDIPPSDLGGVTWSCQAVNGTCTASGNGEINDTVSLSANGKLTYILAGTVAKSESPPLTNKITVTSAANQVDTDPSDNSATDIDTVGIFANGFDSAALGAQSIDIQTQGATGTLTFVSPASLDLALSGQATLVAELRDSATGRAAQVHLVKNGVNTLVRLSFFAGYGNWQIGDWIGVTDTSQVQLNWSTNATDGKRVLERIDLVQSQRLIDRVEMPQEN